MRELAGALSLVALLGLAIAGQWTAAPGAMTPVGVVTVLSVSNGDRGATVARIQRALQIPDDGDFGPQTEAAVRAFQSGAGLSVDGVVGPATANALAGTANGAEQRNGSRGPAVQRIQRALKVSADGIFGPVTEAAVRSFQGASGLSDDGVVGSRTASALFAGTIPGTIHTAPPPPPPIGGPVGTPTHGQPFTVDTVLTRPGGMTAAQLEAFVRAHHPESPFVHDGALFIEAEQRYGVGAQYLLAHAILESDWGRQPIAAFNYFGFNAFDSCPATCATSFTSAEHGILYVAAFIRTQYLTPGGRWFVTPTLRGMNVHYATDPHWATSIAGIASEM